MTPASLDQLPGFVAWRQGLALRRHRALLLLTGGREDCRRKAGELAAAWPGVGPDTAVWLGDAANPDADGHSGSERFQQLAPGQARTLPGRQLQMVVVDSWSGLSPDGLGAAAGCIEGGGTLVLLAPPRSQWPQRIDPDCARHCPWPYTPSDYGHRFWLHLDRSLQGAVVLELAAGRPWPVDWPTSGPPAFDPAAAPVASGSTRDQQAAVAAIERLARGRSRRPLVLIAHRGRGKSAALGLAAGQLLRAGQVGEVIVTAARRSAVTCLFDYAGQAWPEARRRGDSLSLERPGSTGDAPRLRFLPPDQVPETAALVLVDEAAALPATVLRRLLQAPRIVFASTVHGYEGSGRGFDLRFTRELDRYTPHWRRLTLDQPLRWAADDPLEPLLFRALLLDAEPDEPLDPATPCHCQRLDRDRLAADEPLLRALFGLLVAAHYRTSPDDLRELLDAPHIEVWAVTQGLDGPVVGAALVAAEGGLPLELATAVREGRRRAHGHLLAQSLAFHGGWPVAAAQRGARIVRIAIHPAMRRQGLGRALLAAIAAAEARRGTQWLGASFALDPDVIDFWHRAGFVTLRLGVRREAASGERAAQVMKSLATGAGGDWIAAARDSFLRNLPLLLADNWRDLDPELVPALLAGGSGIHCRPGAEARGDLLAFVNGRPLPTCLPALTALARHLLSTGADQYRPDQRAALVLRLLQLHPDREVIARMGLAGAAELLRLLTGVVRQWLAEA